jgi:hypothetical protein
MIEILISLVCFVSGVVVGWKQRDKEKQLDAELNARAIIRQSLAEDPKSFMRVLKRVK